MRALRAGPRRLRPDSALSIDTGHGIGRPTGARSARLRVYGLGRLTAPSSPWVKVAAASRAAGVVPRSTTTGMFPRLALAAGRLTVLGATRDFHHGLLAGDGVSSVCRSVSASISSDRPCSCRALRSTASTLAIGLSVVAGRQFSVDTAIITISAV